MTDGPGSAGGGEEEGVRLATRRVEPDGTPGSGWVRFLHGVFGAGRNWRTVARRLTEARPDWGGELVDLRLHGSSRQAPPPHTLEACARDLEVTVEAGGRRPRVLLGHSFGGKVALTAAARNPEGLEQVWVIDASPSARSPGGSAVEMLRAVRRRPGPFAGRGEAVSALEAEGFPEEVGRWMATNLEEGPEGLRWALDPDALEELLADFFRRDLWAVIEDPPGALEVHLVKAEDSEVVDEEEADRVEQAGSAHGRARLHRLEGGHWLNVSNPEGLLELLERRLPR